jgi:hypothetical protein
MSSPRFKNGGRAGFEGARKLPGSASAASDRVEARTSDAAGVRTSTYAVGGLDKFNGADVHDAGHEFQLVLSLEMTPFDIMRRAAAEYRKVNGEQNWHIYLEQMTISDGVIELAMWS